MLKILTEVISLLLRFFFMSLLFLSFNKRQFGPSGIFPNKCFNSDGKNILVEQFHWSVLDDTLPVDFNVARYLHSAIMGYNI